MLLSLVWPAANAAEPGPWVSLFNGKDFTGWTVPAPNPSWRVEHGVLVGESDEKLKMKVEFQNLRIAEL